MKGRLMIAAEGVPSRLVPRATTTAGGTPASGAAPATADTDPQDATAADAAATATTACPSARCELVRTGFNLPSDRSTGIIGLSTLAIWIPLFLVQRHAMPPDEYAHLCEIFENRVFNWIRLTIYSDILFLFPFRFILLLKIYHTRIAAHNDRAGERISRVRYIKAVTVPALLPEILSIKRRKCVPVRYCFLCGFWHVLWHTIDPIGRLDDPVSF